MYVLTSRPMPGLKLGILSLFFTLFFTNLSIAQWLPSTATSTTPIYRQGSVGIGLEENPDANLHILQGLSRVGPKPSEVPLHPTVRLQKRYSSDLGSGINTWDMHANSSLQFYTGAPESTSYKYVMGIAKSGLTVTGNSLRVGSGNTRLTTGVSLWGGNYIAMNSTSGGGFWNAPAGNGKVVLLSTSDGSFSVITAPEGGLVYPNQNKRLSISPEGEVVIGSEEDNQMIVSAEGKVSIGTDATPDDLDGGDIDISNYRLYVEGGILSDEVRVRTGWADYVFDKDYELLPLSQVKAHITQHGYLHNTPSGTDIENKGLDLGSMASNQQEKIEEIFLHLINLEEKVDTLKEENQALKAKIKELEK